MSTIGQSARLVGTLCTAADALSIGQSDEPWHLSGQPLAISHKQKAGAFSLVPACVASCSAAVLGQLSDFSEANGSVVVGQNLTPFPLSAGGEGKRGRGLRGEVFRRAPRVPRPPRRRPP